MTTAESSAVSVQDLDLPDVELAGHSRDEIVRIVAEAAQQHWLARTPMGYLVSRYDDVIALLGERRFHSAISLIPQMQGMDDVELGDERRARSILALEGLEHNRLRRLVSPAFTPASTEKLRPFMGSVLNDLVDAVAGSGSTELVADVCEPYPIPIICELIGAPKQDWKLFSRLATDIFRIFNQNLAEDAAAIRAASDELNAYLTEMIDDRRRDPRDDLLSRLIAVEEGGDKLTTDEMTTLVASLLLAGTDTTRNQLGCAVALFAQHPDQWALLAREPERAPAAVEEAMRHLGAVRGTIRFASEDIDLKGVRFPQGTLVNAHIAAANHDEATWTDPGRFDITAERDAAQLTFGWGTHFCLGANLARAELQEALVLLATRLPDLELAGEVTWKPDTFGIWGPAVLPLRFTPTAT